MEKQKIYFGFIALLLAIAVLICGCSDTQYTPPSKVEPTSSIQETPGSVTTPSEPETVSTPPKTETPKITTFKVGDTATDNELKVTVNNIKYVSQINEQNNEFLIAKAESGKQYVIVDLTVENVLPDKTQIVSTFSEASIVDQDGYTYGIDFEGLMALDKSFRDGEVLPGMKSRGELAYLVPTSATDLKFIYKFDLFVGTSAVFDIK